MRFHLKKIVTYTFTLICFMALLFNFYNRHLWVITEPSGSSHPWGRNFDPPEEHQLIHKPQFKPANISKEVVSENIAKLQVVTMEASEPTKSLLVWPDKEHYNNDRILNQLKHKPSWITDLEKSGSPVPLKKILLYSGIGGWDVKRGQQSFIDQKCVVNTCEIVDNKAFMSDADAVLFHHSPQRPAFNRPAHQAWILFMLESPYHTPGLSAFSDIINWTATYRHDSEIVAPYERYTLWDENVKTLPQNKSYAAGKSKQVAWFVSNCGARNGRMDYARELGKHISVDIYGSCGPLKCPRRDGSKCFDLLNKDYKFYLAFENSNCRDYITEKFFVNGLLHDVIPIVMGAAPEDYKRAAPPHSFIHVDDFESPKALAEYLHELDKNDDKYNEYFQWKGTGRLLNTHFFCRICAMIHDTSRPNQSYRDLEKWWRGGGVCIGKDNWRQHERTSKYIVDDYMRL